MIHYFTWFVDHLFCLSLILLASFCVGHIVLRRILFDSLIERISFTTALGMGLCGLLLFGLAVFGLLYREVVWTLTVVGAGGSIWCLCSALHREGRRPSRHRFNVWCWGIVAIAAGFWMLLVVSTQYPPVQWDATATHLVLARQYLTEHQIRPNLGVTWPVLPVLNHLLFSWALAIRDDILAQMIEHVFLMLIALGLYSWGKRKNQRLMGVAAAALWLSHPLALWAGNSAYIDVCLAAFAFLGIYALRICWEHKQPGFWMLGLVLLAMAAGTKTTGIVLPVLGTLVGTYLLLRSRLSKRQFVQGVLTAALVALPWYLLIGHFTGNPFWPIFAGYSDGVWGHPTLVGNLDYWLHIGIQKTPLNFFLIPVLLIFRPAHFVPDNYLPLAPLLVLFPICWLVMWKDASVRWWTLWASAIMLTWFSSSQQVRLLLPAIPVMGLAICESLTWFVSHLPRGKVLQPVLWVTVAIISLVSGTRAVLSELKIKGNLPVSKSARETWLADHSRGYLAASFINKHAGPQERVYLVRSSWLNYQFHSPAIAKEGLMQHPLWPSLQWPDESWASYLKSQKIEWILMDRSRMGSKPPPEVSSLSKLEPYYKLVYEDEAAWVLRLQPK